MKQKGFTLYLVLAFLVAAAAGVLYHGLVVKGLEAQVESLEESNRKLTKENTRLEAENATVVGENTRQAELINKQNVSIDAMKAERDQATQRYEKALSLAAASKVSYENSIKKILAMVPPSPEKWCQTWEGMVVDYVQSRQKEVGS